MQRLLDFKKDVILEDSDLYSLPLAELLGSLLTHEMGLNEHEEAGSKIDRRRGLALKSKVVDETEDSEDEDIAIYARRFKKFIRKKKP